MANPFDQFDAPASTQANPFDQFDKPAESAAAFLTKKLKSGIEQLPGLVTGIADIAPAIATGTRPFTAAADWLGGQTGFQPGKWAKQIPQSEAEKAAAADIGAQWKGSEDVLADPNASKTDYAKQLMADAPSIAGAYLRNPMQTAGQVVESVPSMVAGGFMGKGAMLAGRVAGVGVDVAAGTAARAAVPGILERTVGEKLATPIAAGFGEGVVTSGQQMDQYTGPDQQKNAVASLAAGIGTGAIGAVAGRLANKMGLETAETAMVRAGTNVTSEVPMSMKRRILGGMISESVLQELPQSAQEQVWQNYAEGKPLMEGVVRQGIEGALAGAVMGAGANIRGGQSAPEVTLPDASPSTTPGAPSPAPNAPQLGFNPAAGTPQTFPDGSSALGSEAVNAPAPAPAVDQQRAARIAAVGVADPAPNSPLTNAALAAVDSGAHDAAIAAQQATAGANASGQASMQGQPAPQNDPALQGGALQQSQPAGDSPQSPVQPLESAVSADQGAPQAAPEVGVNAQAQTLQADESGNSEIPTSASAQSKSSTPQIVSPSSSPVENPIVAAPTPTQQERLAALRAELDTGTDAKGAPLNDFTRGMRTAQIRSLITQLPKAEIEAARAKYDPAPAAPSTTTQTAPDFQVGGVDEAVKAGLGAITVSQGGKPVPFKDFSLLVHEDGTAEASVERASDSQGGVKGSGFAAYVELGNELASRGVTLTNGDRQNAPGAKLWQQLIRAGHAKRRPSGKGFEFVPGAAQAAPGAPAAELTRAPEVTTGPARVLQNRDRSTAASINQMNNIAKAPDYLRAGQARVMESGAPVVFGSAPAGALVGKSEQVADATGQRVPVQYAVVEAADILPSHQADGTPISEYEAGAPGKLRAVAGNGRAAGISEGYRRNTATQYRQDLTDDAENLGVDPAAVAAMRAPVLVRVMPEELVTDDIGDRSNIRGTSDLSPAEQAANDTRRIDIKSLEFDESGTPDPQSIARFVQAMSDGERNTLIQPDGITPTRQLIDRITSAAFKAAYGNDRLVQLQAQSTDTEIRNIITAMASAAGPMANLEGTGDFDIRGAVAEAAQMAVNAKRSGIPLTDYLNNADINFSGEAFTVAAFLADNIRSAKRMGDGLRAWADYAAEQAAIVRENETQGAMFGPTPTADRATTFNQLGVTNDQSSAAQIQDGASRVSRVEDRAPRQEVQPDAGQNLAGDFEAQSSQVAETVTQQPEGANSEPQADQTQPQQTQPEAPAASVPDEVARRPAGWRNSRLQAGAVARKLGIDAKGMSLAEVVAAVERADVLAQAAPAAPEAQPANEAAAPAVKPPKAKKPTLRESVAQAKAVREAAMQEAADQLVPAQDTLTTPAAQDIIDQQDRAEAAAKAEKSQQRAADELARREDVRKDIAKASTAAANTFELGGNAEQNLSGQQSVFDAPAEQSAPAAEQKAAPADDLNAMFDDIMAETAPAAPPTPAEAKTTPAKPRATPAKAPRTATQAAGSAAKNTAAALANAIDGLGALFGAKSKGRIGSGLSFDENTYAQAKPLFIQAVANLKDASADIREAMRAVINMVTDKFGRETTENMKPYIVRFASDVRDGTITQEELNAASTNANLERDSAEPATEPAVGDAVPADARGAATADAGAGGQTSAEAGRGQQDRTGIPFGSAPVTRERGDQPVSAGNPAPELASILAGADFREPGGDSGITGVPPEPIPASEVDAVADAGNVGLKAGIERARADKAPVRLADIDSIRATLPQLLPGQQDDVLKAEQRFSNPKGYGMLFTNGTGTGKTFTGLGIIKRFARQGKTNTLIVVPDDKIAADWIESGKVLGLEISKLKDIKDAGRGIVITSYANMGANDALATRQWDAVVADEAHTLSQDKNGTPTTYLHNLRAITHHPDGVHQRYTMLNRPEIELTGKISEAISKAERLLNKKDIAPKSIQALQALQDEAALLREQLNSMKASLESSRKSISAEVASTQEEKRTRLITLSATPFAYEKTVDWAQGYLFDYRDGYPFNETAGAYNQPSPREYYFQTRFGYRMKTGKLTQPDAGVDSSLMQRQFNTELKKSGALSGRMLEVAPDYDRRFVLLNSAIGTRIDEAMQWLSKELIGSRPDLLDEVNEKFGHLQKRYLLEAIKAEAAIPIVKQHMAMGRKVVVFHDYKQGGGFNPFAIKPKEISVLLEAFDKSFNLTLAEFNQKFSDLVNYPFAKMGSPVDVFQREIPGVLLVNGDEKKSDLLARYKRFQDDSTGPLVMLVQSAKNKGWSGHDTTGKNQRVLINLGQPTAPTLAIQQEGRIYRTGQASDAIMRYLNTGTNWERWTFATTIAGRASAAENLGMGESARALKDSLIQSFEEADTYAPGHEGEGKGGKERDKAANNALTEFDRAKALYWANQKKTSRTKAQEGADYFATPEPLGLKMVQWLDARNGEDVLEPSGGHGAIARWFPEKTSKTVIEPSMALRSRLALAMNTAEDRIIGGTFEDHAIVNKYDGIAMNPSFGTAGRTAVDHIAKAAQHLRDGGRIVALLPDGPSATAKFEKWLNGESEVVVRPLAIHPTLGEIYPGDTLKMSGFGDDFKIVAHAVDGPKSGPQFVRAKGTLKDRGINLIAVKAIESTGERTKIGRTTDDLYHVGTINLPTVTFERAGTGVKTRIVILEKQTEAERAPASQRDIDLSDITEIDELFSRLENLAMPPRPKVDPIEADEVKTPSKAAKPAKTTRPMTELGATVVLDGNPYKVTTYTTNAGKAIRGVWVPKKPMAERFGSTFQKRGEGWFVREANFPAQEAAPAAATPAFIRATTQTKGMTAAQVQAIADKISAGWSNAPRIVVVANMADPRIPQAARDEDQRQRATGATGNPEGFVHDGVIYLLADQLASPERAATVLMHEALGHIGLQGVFGDSLKGILQQVATMRQADIKAKAAQYGLDMSDPAQRLQAAEEVLAEMAQSRPEIGFVKRAVAAIRNWLRANVPGIGPKELTDDDIVQAYLLPARGWVERGRAAGAGGSAPMFSRSPAAAINAALNATTETTPGNTGRYDAAQIQAMRDVGFTVTGKSVAERTREFWKDAGKKMAQGLADQFAPIKDISGEAYRLLRQSKSASGAFETLLRGGQIKLTDGTYNFDEAKRGGVVEKLLTPLQGEHHDMFRWIAANRAERLMNESEATRAEGLGLLAEADTLDKSATALDNQAKQYLQQAGNFPKSMTGNQQAQKSNAVEANKLMTQAKKLRTEASDKRKDGNEKKNVSRENLFTREHIAAFKRLTDGQTNFDFTLQNGIRRGQVTRNRAEIYKDSLTTFNAFNKNVLDMAEQSGLIDPESRAVWEQEFYVPFYRVADESDGGVRSMSASSSVVRQKAFEMLKGGRDKLNADLLDNVLMNWAHLLDAGAKNRAAKATLEAAEAMGVAIGAPEATVRSMAGTISKKNNVVWFMDGGKQRYFLVDDPYVFTAITALEYAGMKNPVMDAMGTFKRVLTVGVTASPFFKIRNLIRDSLQVVASGPIGYNVAGNIKQGWALTDPKNDGYFRLLAGGGTIHFGTMYEGSEAKRVQSLVESGVKDATILDGDHKVKAFYRKFIEPGITAYNELGNRGEAINRAALYDQLVKQGMSHGEASLQARDLMDFSMQGSFTAIRFLTQVVPFLNARIQGLYKLGRAAQEDPRRMATVLGAVAGFSLLLLAAYSDDDDWKKREEWDRNNYWWFKFGGESFRIPKPFEVGAIGTLAERGFELAFDKEMTNKRFMEQVRTLLSDNLAMNPVPQMFKPMIDVYANKDSFSGRPIEGMGMERLRPEYRFNAGTSLTARGTSTALNAAASIIGKDSLSPVQIDHMLRSYFGWLGSFAVGTADVITRPLMNEPGRPTPDYWKAATGSIASSLDGAQSRYVSSMYEQAKQIEQDYGTWRAMLKTGKFDEAREFRADRQESISRFNRIEQVKRQTATLNEQIRIIERSSADGDTKREKITRIRNQQDRIARLVSGA